MNYTIPYDCWIDLRSIVIIDKADKLNITIDGKTMINIDAPDVMDNAESIHNQVYHDGVPSENCVKHTHIVPAIIPDENHGYFKVSKGSVLRCNTVIEFNTINEPSFSEEELNECHAYELTMTMTDLDPTPSLDILYYIE